MSAPTIYAVLTALTLTSISFSQEEKSKFKLSEVEIYGGGLTTVGAGLTAPELFDKFADQEDLVMQFQNDYDGLESHSWWQSETNGLFGLKFYFDGKNHQHFQLRYFVGANHAMIGAGYLYASSSEAHPYDTLTSSQSGDTYYVDSVSSLDYSFNGYYSAVGLEVGAMMDIHLGPQFNFGIGLSYNYRIGIQNDLMMTRTESQSFTYPEGFSGISAWNHESAKLNSNHFISNAVHVPLSFDFRFSKKENNWARLKARISANPGIAVMSTPFYGSRMVPMSAYALGLSVGL